MKTIEEIQQAYARAATVAGDIQYRIVTMQEELRKANREMRRLNTVAQGIANAKANAEKEASNGTQTAEQANA